MVPTIYYHFWVRYHPSRVYSQKKLQLEAKYRSLFPTTIKPHPLNPLDRGLSSLVLAGYRLVVLRPFCACSTVFCICLPCRFCRSKLVLFHSAACFILFLHAFPTTFVISLWFGFSFLHMIPTAYTSCRSLFLLVMLLYISFRAYPFIQKYLGLCGPDNVDWIKNVLGPICLCLPKPFCQKTVFYDKLVFCCRSLSLAFLSLDLSCSSVFLVGLWALLFIGFSSIWDFGHGFKKWVSTFNPLSIWIAPTIHMRKLMQFSFVGCFTTHMWMLLFFFFAGLLFQSLLSLGKSFSFFLQIHDPPRIAKKKKFFFMRVVVLLLSSQSEFIANFASFGPVVYFPSAKFQ